MKYCLLLFIASEICKSLCDVSSSCSSSVCRMLFVIDIVIIVAQTQLFLYIIITITINVQRRQRLLCLLSYFHLHSLNDNRVQMDALKWSHHFFFQFWRSFTFGQLGRYSLINTGIFCRCVCVKSVHKKVVRDSLLHKFIIQSFKWDFQQLPPNAFDNQKRIPAANMRPQLSTNQALIWS